MGGDFSYKVKRIQDAASPKIYSSLSSALPLIHKQCDDDNISADQTQGIFELQLFQ